MAYDSGRATMVVDMSTGKDMITNTSLSRMPTTEGVQIELMSWTTTSDGEPVATTADSGDSVGASYSGLDLGAHIGLAAGTALKPRRMSMTFSLTSGSANSGSAVMISNPNGLGDIDDITGTAGASTGTGSGLTRVGKGSLHIVATETKVDIGIYTSNSLSATTVNYLNGDLTKDGATKYSLTAEIHEDRIIVWLPDGQVWTNVSANYYTAAGRYIQFESYTGSASATRASFYAFGAEAEVL